MILDRFQAAFTVTADRGDLIASTPADFGIDDFNRVLDTLGGKTFNGGLYRVFRPDQIPAAKQAMERVFPEYCGRIVPFAFDWLGRHFASDRERIEKGQPLVLMLEVGAGEAMEIPASITDFHNVELVEYADVALALPFWKQWRELSPADLAFNECVGYKVPLFLGGADVLANLEIIDISVYVETCGQLRNATRTLPSGHSIRQVTIGD